MSDIIETIHRNAVYWVKELFWKPENVRDEQVVDRLKRYDISLYSLNHHLDQAGFPDNVGRFPGILSYYSKIHDTITSALDTFWRNQSQLHGDVQTAREVLRNNVSLAVATYLDSEIEAERRIFREHGFWSE